jgi:hypothetical protein
VRYCISVGGKIVCEDPSQGKHDTFTGKEKETKVGKQGVGEEVSQPA